ncbi:MAG: IpaC/SipC family type III secretion system effector [Lachnospiraceae bacterium]|nr:IpaC/SipC family type III secretion system effector [Lachnospiraceae bacterium]
MYQKEIIYMSLYEKEIKQGCVGYLKLETKQDKYQLEVQVKKIPRAITGNFPIRLQSETGWREIGMLAVKDGCGKWTGNIANALLKAEILLSESSKIKGESKVTGESKSSGTLVKKEKDSRNKTVTKDNQNTNGKAQAQTGTEQAVKQGTETETLRQPFDERMEEAEIKPSSERIEEVATKPSGKRMEEAAIKSSGKRMEEAEIKPSGKKMEEAAIQPTAQGHKKETSHKTIGLEEQASRVIESVGTQKETDVATGSKADETVLKAESIAGAQRNVSRLRPIAKAPRVAGRREHTPLYENKWEQLLSTYEQIHPYGDERIYVKLEPRDFVVLRENYQHLVNNSFLLHGFYNYRYLILGREKGFYLGVPGVFYEREKMVALMFGFEAFECEGGDVEEGKFGYYLRKVEL